ncbi:hypothetical protein HMPREF0322_04102 [Desulfitobacterium hafniense DP7]|uniref:Uncharacterized protein n=1 Tax=Desulfitobacterium hafniense DP7 TaxID=537010 RepID=G9XSZ6_DESHA|nr:hypothetical protein HMPREF0322_04102 [Desulfitobacterium hafniense DP7]
MFNVLVIGGIIIKYFTGKKGLLIMWASKRYHKNNQRSNYLTKEG